MILGLGYPNPNSNLTNPTYPPNCTFSPALMLSFMQYVDGKHLPSAIYRCSFYEIDICIYEK